MVASFVCLFCIVSVATSCKDAETAEQQCTLERRRFSTRRENTSDAAQCVHIMEADKIMDEIRSLGHYPRENGPTRALAQRRRRAEKAGEFSAAQLEELRMMKTQQNEKSLRDQCVHIMEAIRALGYLPKRRSEHARLVKQYEKAVKSNKLTSEEIEEVEALTAAHAAVIAQSMAPPPEACAPVNGKPG